MRYELVLQREEGHILSYHVKKKQIFLRKFIFCISKFKFQNGLKQKTSSFLGFFLRQTGLYEPNPLKSLQILLQIPRPVSNMKILTPGLAGDQIEMVA